VIVKETMTNHKYVKRNVCTTMIGVRKMYRGHCIIKIRCDINDKHVDIVISYVRLTCDE